MKQAWKIAVKKTSVIFVHPKTFKCPHVISQFNQCN